MSSGDEHPQLKPKLSPDDYATNAFQAMLKGIPILGSSLEQFLFGPLQELRMRRIEATLQEIAAILQQKNIPPSAVETEEFANLLESVAPALSRSTNEDRRQRFRDLLLNAAQTPSGDPSWEEVKLASTLLDAIDAPGLVILAALSKTNPQNRFDVVSVPTPQVFEGRFDFDNPPGTHHVLPYEWRLIDEWVSRLREMRLIDTRGGFGRGGHSQVCLTDVGKMLIRWTLTPD